MVRPRAPDEQGFLAARRALVAHLRVCSRIRDPRVLAAFERVPRHLFVPAAGRSAAYQDHAIALAEGQTVSQPTMIAIMLEALACAPEHRALEVGAGSGYAAALLAELCADVNAVELRPALAEIARHNLARAGVERVCIHVADGCRGLPDRAPFDRILVSAGAASVPAALLDQLAAGGRIAIPVNEGDRGQLLRVGVRGDDGSIRWQAGVPCTFVPLVECH